MLCVRAIVRLCVSVGSSGHCAYPSHVRQVDRYEHVVTQPGNVML